MTAISCMSANFVARELDYHMTEGWSQGDRAANEYFAPIETFAARFDQLLAAVRAMGFDAVDVWMGHLNWRWASDQHIAIARDLLARHGLTVTSLAGGFGTTMEELDAACRLAVALGTTIPGGGAPIYDADRAGAIAVLRRHRVTLAIENHPGVLTPHEMLAAIGDGAGGVIGTTVDTGWYGTAELDATRAIEQLGGHILHVHLKDVLAPGSHETCRYGRGCVPIEQCVSTLQKIGYQGAISVEHEPESFDPTEDCIANLTMLRAWVHQ